MPLPTRPPTPKAREDIDPRAAHSALDGQVDYIDLAERVSQGVSVEAVEAVLDEDRYPTPPPGERR